MNPRRRRHNRIARKKRRRIESSAFGLLAAKLERATLRLRVTSSWWGRFGDEMAARLIVAGKL